MWNVRTGAAILALCCAGSAYATPFDAASVQALFPETTARPLFSQTRRPVPQIVPVQPEVAVVTPETDLAPTPVAAAVPQPQFDGAGLLLRGVIGRSGNLIALIEQTGGGADYRLALGPTQLPGSNGKLMDVDVLEISGTHVVLRGDQAVTLTLRPENDTADAVATVAAPTLLAQAPADMQLSPIPRAETVARHSPTGVQKTSLFTISASN